MIEKSEKVYSFIPFLVGIVCLFLTLLVSFGVKNVVDFQNEHKVWAACGGLPQYLTFGKL